MCVIMHKPLDVKLSHDTLFKAWKANSDGAGVLIVTAEKNLIIKGLMTLKKLGKVVRKYQDYEMVLHFRLATHGAKTQQNTHPFRCGDGHLFHNGIISGFGTHGEGGYSDSKDLALTLGKLPPKDIRRLLDHISGKYIYIDGNELSYHGHFETYKGLKVSNTYFDRSPTPTYYKTDPKDYTFPNNQKYIGYGARNGAHSVWDNEKGWTEIHPSCTKDASKLVIDELTGAIGYEEDEDDDLVNSLWEEELRYLDKTEDPDSAFVENLEKALKDAFNDGDGSLEGFTPEEIEILRKTSPEKTDLDDSVQ